MALKNTKQSWLKWVVEKRDTGHFIVVTAGAGNLRAAHEALISGHTPTVAELEKAKAATAKQLLNQ